MGPLSTKEKIELAQALEEKRRREARSSILDFIKYTKPDYRPNWHHELICKYLDKFISGEITRLMVFAPPRHGKSEIVSRRLPAYLFGKNPNASIIACSYSSDLSSMMNRDVQRIMDSQEYAELFPRSSLNAANVRTTSHNQYLRNSDVFQIVGSDGVYRSAGVGGGITGMGCTHAIIDDSIKNQEEADSTVVREKIWGWYTSTLYTRLQNPRCILLTQTCWHEDDLGMRLLKQAKEDPAADQWTVLRLPARYEADGQNVEDPRALDEPLWKEDFGDEVLNSIKVSVGSRVWNALYQQRPAAQEGNIVKRGWLRFWDTTPQFEEMLVSVDATFTGKATSDFVAMQVWGRWGAQKYLMDQVHRRMGITDTIQALIDLCAKWPDAKLKIIENKANGPAIEDLLKRNMSGIVLVEPKGDKIARLNAITPQLEAGNVFFPMPSRNPWVESLIDELVTFPNAVHDDRTDALSQALLRLEESCSQGVGKIRILR